MPSFKDRLSPIYGYYRAFGRIPNLIRPKRFTDKLVSRRVFYRNNSLMATTADKWAVRGYIEEKVGISILSKVYAVTDDIDQLDLKTLPLPVVLKSSHGSGHVKIFADRSFDESKVKTELTEWLKQKFPLWYRKVPPRIIAEEFLGTLEDGKDLSATVPKDYKFFVIHGKVELIVVDVDRFSEHKRALYLPSWELLDVEYHYPKAKPQPRPENLEKMLQLASKLGEDFEFVRIDLYDLGNRIVFGEITHSPDRGNLHFNPPEFDYWLGKRL